MEEELLWEKRGYIRIITYNRPQVLNAMTMGMYWAEDKCLEEFINDDEARVLIYTGSGRAFCTGLDLTAIKELLAASDSIRPRTLIRNKPEIWKPIIAAVNGYAVGGGLELAMACDIRIAADNARFGLPEVKRGLIAGGGGCQLLPRLVPLGNALQILFSGELIDAQEAHRIGLVQKVVPADQLMDEAIKLAEIISENAPFAVRLTKEAVYRSLDEPLETALAQKAFYSMRNRELAPEDNEEGIAAFKAKRKPVFKGR